MQESRTLHNSGTKKYFSRLVKWKNWQLSSRWSQSSLDEWLASIVTVVLRWSHWHFTVGSRGTTASTLAPAAALSAVSGRVNGIVNSYFGCERILLALCGGQTQTTPTPTSENRKVWEKFKHICDVVSYIMEDGEQFQYLCHSTLVLNFTVKMNCRNLGKLQGLGFVFRIYFYFRLLHIFAIMFWYILHPMNLWPLIRLFKLNINTI